jgi:hypothetical protein
LQESLKERDHFEDLGVDGGKYCNRFLRNMEGMWSAFIWFRVRTSEGLL